MTHLLADRYRAERLRRLCRSSRNRVAAESLQYRKQQQELEILMVATERGIDWTNLDLPLALALAQAAHSTLEAEKEAVKKRIAECEAMLATLHDTYDDAHGRAEEAATQVDCVMSIVDEQGLQINLAEQIPKPQTIVLGLPISSGIETNSPEDEDEACSDDSGSGDPHGDGDADGEDV